MQKFKFNLEKVLEVREIEEEMAQNRLAAARQKAAEIKEQLARIEKVQHDLYHFLRNEEDLSVADNIQVRQYLNTNRDKIKQIKDRLIEQKQEVDKRRDDYLDCRRQKQALENLREKEYKRFNQELLLKEQKELDEIGLRLKRAQGV